MIIDPTAVLCSNKLDDVVLSNLDPERDSTSDGDSKCGEVKSSQQLLIRLRRCS
jgi:hypothetical protein